VDDVPGGLAGVEEDDAAVLLGLAYLVQQLGEYVLVGAGVVHGPGVQCEVHGRLQVWVFLHPLQLRDPP
jgi:hypothetical protein